MRQIQRDVIEWGQNLIILAVVVVVIVGLLKYISGDRPGEDGWTREDRDSYIREQLEAYEAQRDAYR